MSDQDERKEYEEPTLTEYGTIEEVTKGSVNIGIDDVPLGQVALGHRVVTPTSTAGSGAVG